MRLGERWYLICELEDDDFPAHPAELVTARSLRKAFSKDRTARCQQSVSSKLSKHKAYCIISKFISFICT